MSVEEYKARFIARMTSQGVVWDFAQLELASHLEENPDLFEYRLDPEMDADEVMGSWE